MDKTRRFIAGAVCPACQQADRIVLEDLAHGQRRICVACGFSEDLAAENVNTAPSLPRARHERSKAPEVQPQVVRILEP